MKILAVTFDDRPKWREYAEVHRQRFEALNHIETTLLPVEAWPQGLCYPHYGKLWLWDMIPTDVDRVIWFDSDIFPLRSLGDLPSAPMSMVEDSKSWVVSDLWPRCEKLRGIWPYWNSGFIVMDRSMRFIFDECKKIVPRTLEEKGNEWGWMWDQNVINHIIYHTGNSDKVCSLPRLYNYHSGFPRPMPQSVMMLHLTTWGCIGQHKLMFMDMLHNMYRALCDGEEAGDAHTTVYG